MSENDILTVEAAHAAMHRARRLGTIGSSDSSAELFRHGEALRAQLAAVTAERDKLQEALDQISGPSDGQEVAVLVAEVARLRAALQAFGRSDAEVCSGAAVLCESEARRFHNAVPSTAEHWESYALVLRSLDLRLNALVAACEARPAPPTGGEMTTTAFLSEWASQGFNEPEGHACNLCPADHRLTCPRLAARAVLLDLRTAEAEVARLRRVNQGLEADKQAHKNDARDVRAERDELRESNRTLSRQLERRASGEDPMAVAWQQQIDRAEAAEAEVARLRAALNEAKMRIRDWCENRDTSDAVPFICETLEPIVDAALPAPPPEEK